MNVKSRHIAIQLRNVRVISSLFTSFFNHVVPFDTSRTCARAHTHTNTNATHIIPRRPCERLHVITYENCVIQFLCKCKSNREPRLTVLRVSTLMFLFFLHSCMHLFLSPWCEVRRWRRRFSSTLKLSGNKKHIVCDSTHESSSWVSLMTEFSMVIFLYCFAAVLSSSFQATSPEKIFTVTMLRFFYGFSMRFWALQLTAAHGRNWVQFHLPRREVPGNEHGVKTNWLPYISQVTFVCRSHSHHNFNYECIPIAHVAYSYSGRHRPVHRNRPEWKNNKKKWFILIAICDQYTHDIGTPSLVPIELRILYSQINNIQIPLNFANSRNNGSFH